MRARYSVFVILLYVAAEMCWSFLSLLIIIMTLELKAGSMTSASSKYFAKAGAGKRKPLSTSSASDTCTSPELSHKAAETESSEQDTKKQRRDSISGSDYEDMVLQTALEEINQKLVNLATKDKIR